MAQTSTIISPRAEGFTLPKESLILGIDPGSWITGYGIVEMNSSSIRYIASGCVRNAQQDLAERLRNIHEAILSLIDRYQPTHFAIELAFVHQKINVSSALKLGQVRGIAILAATLRGLPIAEYAPRLVKKNVVGYGAANKQQVQQMMVRLLELSGTPAVDAADALAIAYCHACTLGTMKARNL